jgi:hypothetical protein
VSLIFLTRLKKAKNRIEKESKLLIGDVLIHYDPRVVVFKPLLGGGPANVLVVSVIFCPDFAAR